MKTKNPNSVPHQRRKEGLLPRITQLTLEGHSSRAIGSQIGVSKTTVNRWLLELRQEWIAKAMEDNAEMIAIAIARYQSIYREAMEAWRRSKTDKQTRLIEKTGAVGDGDGAKQKKSVRTETRAGNADFLSKATEIVKAIVDLKGLRTPQRTEIGGPVSGTIDLASVKPSDCRNLSNAQLVALEIELEAKIAREEARCEAYKNDAQLAALQAQIKARFQTLQNLEPAK